MPTAGDDNNIIKQLQLSVQLLILVYNSNLHNDYVDFAKRLTQQPTLSHQY